MITYYLGDQEVAAYCLDLAKRLFDESPDFPRVWVPLGESGKKIADVLLDEVVKIDATKAADVSMLVARYNRASDEIGFSGGFDIGPISSPTVLVLDSAVHSGRSMYKLVQYLQSNAIQAIVSYGLVLKSGSVLVPTYFGVVIDDKDRAYFQLDVLPNNRLGHPPPLGLLREIENADVGRNIEGVGAPFVGLTVGDLLYDKATKSLKVYIFESEGKIAGFISFKRNGGVLFVDSWGTGESFKGRGIGGATMRWAETWARSQKCDRIELWAYKGAIDIYKKYSYEYADSEERDLGDELSYRIMQKKILYNIKLNVVSEVDYY